MSDWTLRLARLDDAPYLPEIEARAARLFESVDGLSGLAAQHTMSVNTLRRLIRKGHSLVAFMGEEMAGFLVTEPCGRELHICECDVDPRFQRRGIGAGLLRASIIDATNCGFHALTLTTFRDVAWNGPFYNKLGFEEVSDPVAHPRLMAILDQEIGHGLPGDRRCAMIRFLD